MFVYLNGNLLFEQTKECSGDYTLNSAAGPNIVDCLRFQFPLKKTDHIQVVMGDIRFCAELPRNFQPRERIDDG